MRITIVFAMSLLLTTDAQDICKHNTFDAITSFPNGSILIVYKSNYWTFEKRFDKKAQFRTGNFASLVSGGKLSELSKIEAVVTRKSGNINSSLIFVTTEGKTRVHFYNEDDDSERSDVAVEDYFTGGQFDSPIVAAFSWAPPEANSDWIFLCQNDNNKTEYWTFEEKGGTFVSIGSKRDLQSSFGFPPENLTDIFADDKIVYFFFKTSYRVFFVDTLTAEGPHMGRLSNLGKTKAFLNCNIARVPPRLFQIVMGTIGGLSLLVSLGLYITLSILRDPMAEKELTLDKLKTGSSTTHS